MDEMDESVLDLKVPQRERNKHRMFAGFVFGFIICLGLAACACIFWVIPHYGEQGFANGKTEGIKIGTSAGYAKGMSDGRAGLLGEQKHAHDSMIAVANANEAARKARMKARKPAPRPQQNWHVIDGKIADAIVSQ